ncbi:MAG TPA: M1 family aminopeptidase [Labilithrix sp.]|nr:M1 family aminopeptidase [Labilithrix sp.]
MTLTELRLLRAHVGLWLVVPLTLLVSVQEALSLRGPFDTKLLPTPGLLAVKSFGTLSTLVVLLTMFVITESFAREHGTRVFSLVTGTRVRSSVLVFGKILSAVVFAAIVFGLGAGVLLAIVAVLNPSAFSLWPLLLIYGAMGLPTAFFTAAFCAWVFTRVRSRYATYAIGLGAVVATGFAFVRGHVGWWSNWPLWKVVAWSDMSVLELDRRMLIGNRLTVIALGVAFASAAALRYARRHPDGDHERATPPAERRRARRTLALLSSPAAVLFAVLVFWTETSRGGTIAKDAAKDYWRANVRTFADAPVPQLSRVALTMRLAPPERSAEIEGTYELVNRTDKALHAVPLTLGPHMRAPRFTAFGAKVESEARAGLHLLKLGTSLAPGARVVIGFSYHADFSGGLVGFGAQEFLVPAGGTLTSFGASLVPSVGFVDGMGVDAENRAEPRVYDDDFHLGVNPGLLGTGSAFEFRLEVTMPSDYRVNSVGILTHDEVHDRQRTMIWEADAPIHFFDVLVGRDWQEARRGDVAVYHLPAHGAQVPEMLEALSLARTRYSEWFYPYPWKELRISEFPGLVHYAQGHPTNINFSESIGFLSARGEDLPFAITAHEVGHQWWGTLVNPARGPGASVMTEGLSHMSALLLLEDAKGAAARRAFAKGMEARYAAERSVDGERPLVRVSAEADRRGDRVLVYDRAGWAFWMLAHHLGMARMSKGLHAFVESYRDNPDHPALEDLFTTLRREASDTARFDAFVTTWFRTSAVPRFRVEGAKAVGRDVSFRVVNEGTGRVEVPVAVVGRGGREIVTAIVEPGAPAEIKLSVGFDPSGVIVDPDVEVLQLGRSAARVSL